MDNIHVPLTVEDANINGLLLNSSAVSLTSFVNWPLVCQLNESLHAADFKWLAPRVRRPLNLSPISFYWLIRPAKPSNGKRWSNTMQWGFVLLCVCVSTTSHLYSLMTEVQEAHVYGVGWLMETDSTMNPLICNGLTLSGCWIWSNLPESAR